MVAGRLLSPNGELKPDPQQCPFFSFVRYFVSEFVISLVSSLIR